MAKKTINEGGVDVCAACRGNGQVTAYCSCMSRDPMGKHTCSKCRNTGTVYVTCRACGGKGY